MTNGRLGKGSTDILTDGSIREHCEGIVGGEILVVHERQRLQAREHQILRHLCTQSSKSNQQHGRVAESEIHELLRNHDRHSILDSPVLRLHPPKTDLSVVHFGLFSADFLRHLRVNWVVEESVQRY
jgi:hypothetical protein